MPEGLDEIFAAVEAEDTAAEVDDTDSGFDSNDDNPDLGGLQGHDEGTVTDSDQVDDDDLGGDTDNSDEEIGGDDHQEQQSFDWQQYADQLVPIIVDGQEKLVPLGELRNGYMRQDAWTQRTQKLAEAEQDAQWARAVRAKLMDDPAGTLSEWAEAFGLTPDKMFAPDPFADVDEDLRPIVEQNRQLSQQVQQLMEAQQQQQMAQRNAELVEQVKAEIDQLTSELGDDFDAEASLRYAAAYNIPLSRAAYIVVGERSRQQKHSQTEAQRQAEAAAEAERQRQEKQRTKAKKQASQKNGRFNASEIPTDDFEDIGQLMEMMMSDDGIA